MVRQIVALVFITFAAPYLVLHWLLVLGPWPTQLLGARGYENVLLIGTVGVTIYGLPVLLFSACLFLSLKKLGFINWLSYALSGAFIGFCVMFIVTSRMISFSGSWGVEVSHPEVFGMRIVGLPAGIICSWIYWIVAIKRTPNNGHAIDPA